MEINNEQGDSKIATRSTMAIQLMDVARKYCDDSQSRYLGAYDVAMKSIEGLLAPVCEAMQAALDHPDLLTCRRKAFAALELISLPTSEANHGNHK